MPPTHNLPGFISTILLCAAGLLALGCERRADVAVDQATEAATVKHVAAVQARLEPWPETIRIQGSLLAYEDAVVGSKLAGRVDKVNVDIGSVVKAGQPLVSLVRSELDLRLQLAEAQLRQACAAIGLAPNDDEAKYNVQLAPGVMMEEALVNEAQSNVDRARSLVAARAITQGEYDTLIAQLKAAQARHHSALNLVSEQVAIIGVRRKELALAQQMITDSQVLAPFDGIIGDRRVSAGEFVQVGQAVVSLVRADRLRFTAGVPESRATAVRVGQRVDLHLGASGTPPIVATVSRVSPTVMQSSRSILIQADVNNPQLAFQAGLFGEAELVIDAEAQAIVVPLSAVSRFAGVEKVWVIQNGVASQRTVRTGREDGSRVEIVDGLAVGSVLVRNAADGHDGPAVAVDESPDVPLQAQFPDSSSTKRTSSGGAQ
jgi:RND family efflux transporter MFP subunit